MRHHVQARAGLVHRVTPVRAHAHRATVHRDLGNAVQLAREKRDRLEEALASRVLEQAPDAVECARIVTACQATYAES